MNITHTIMFLLISRMSPQDYDATDEPMMSEVRAALEEKPLLLTILRHFNRVSSDSFRKNVVGENLIKEVTQSRRLQKRVEQCSR